MTPFWDWLPKSETPALEAALTYTGHGLVIIPLYAVDPTTGHCSCPAFADCQHAGKHPIDRGWQRAKPDSTRIRAAFVHRKPTPNLGWVMGGEQRYVALDVDGEVGLHSLSRLVSDHGELPETLKSRSGRLRGEHHIFRCPEHLALDAIKNDTNVLGPGLDVRATGGQIVVCPSVHHNGQRYQWQNAGPVADLPTWLYRLLVSPQTRSDQPKGNGSNGYAQTALASACRRIRSAQNGSRNRVLNVEAFSIAGLVAADALDQVAAWEALRAAALEAGLPANEVDRTLESGFRAGLAAPRKLPTRQVEREAVKKQVEALGETSESTCELPEIFVGPDEERVTTQALSALAGCENLFQRGGELVQVVHAKSPLGGVTRPAGAPRIASVQEARLRELTTTQIRWLKPAPRSEGPNEEWVWSHPPSWATKAIAARGQWETIRPLEAVVSVPVLRPDGSVLTAPGYDEKTGLYYEPAGNTPVVQEHPTLEQAQRAAEMLFEVVSDFPFETKAHRAAWLAALLTPLARYAFEGPAPLILIDKNVRGAGAGLLTDTISLLATGRPAARMPYTESDEEMRKRILAIALAGDPLVLLDNVGGTLGCPSFDAALTATEWSDRVLGASDYRKVPLYTTWIATGNNVAMGADTTRRTMHIRLSSPLENPEERQDFRHPHLLEWLQEQQTNLLGAALTLLRAYCVAARPRQGIPAWGSFEGWSALVRSTVVWLGEPDPAETRRELTKRSDQESSLLGLLLDGWLELDPAGIGMTVAHMLERLADPELREAYPTLRAAIAEMTTGVPGKGPDPRSLGNQFKHLRGRVKGDKALDSKDSKRGALWFVRRVGSVT